MIRCLGVSAASREGQLDSQKPHSMQRSTSGDASGEGLRFLTWTSGSWEGVWGCGGVGGGGADGEGEREGEKSTERKRGNKSE